MKRMPDGNPGGRRLWISWQYLLLRNCNFFKLLEGYDGPVKTGSAWLTLADGVDPSAIPHHDFAIQ